MESKVPKPKIRSTYLKPSLTCKKILHNVWMMRARSTPDDMLSGELLACWIGTCSAFGGSGPCSWSC